MRSHLTGDINLQGAQCCGCAGSVVSGGRLPPTNAEMLNLHFSFIFAI